MRVTVFAAAFACACAVGIALQEGSASAATTTNINQESVGITVALLEPSASLPFVVEEETSQEQPIAEPEIIKHKVADGESLSKIAQQYEVTWQRIFYKNTQIEDPNQINPGAELIIPHSDEVLEERQIPEPVIVKVTSAPKENISTKPVTPVARTSTSGNGYVAGYCTWYVKNRRPDLPNNLGNARTWVSRAAAQGIPTGVEPRVGAVGQRGNHVVYVESVNGDGTITISDMNYRALYEVTTRTVSASSFSYIY